MRSFKIAMMTTFIISSLLSADCTDEEIKRASELYEEFSALSDDTISYDQKMAKLKQSLRVCPELSNAKFAKYILQIDHYLDRNQLSGAKNEMEQLSRYLDYVEDANIRNSYEKELLKRRKRYFLMKGERGNANDIDRKLLNLNRQIDLNRIKSEDEIYNDLKPIPGGKAMGVSERETSLFIRYEHDSSRLTLDKAKRQVEKLKRAFIRLSKAYDSGKSEEIHILGYTNTIGSAGHNLILSKNRAETIKRELEKVPDINRIFTIFIEGKGETEPICNDSGYAEKDSNDTTGREYRCSNNKENEEAGRRVRIIIPE